MLVRPTVYQPLRVLAIDPGTTCMGISLLEWGIEERQYHVREAFTLVAKDNHPQYRACGELHGARSARIQQLTDRLGDVLRRINPDDIIVETPYLGRYAESFEALVECLTSIHNTIYLYNRFMPLYQIDPTSAKKAVGVRIERGKKSNKEDVRVALSKRTDIIWHVDLAALDEHSVDATAIGMYHILNNIVSLDSFINSLTHR